MKYANQVNLVLTGAGLLIVVYAFSITFFAGPPPLNLDPDQMAELIQSRPEVSRGRVTMRNAVTTSSPSVEGASGRFSQGRGTRSTPAAERAPVGAGSGLVGGGGARMPAAGQRRSLDAQRETGPNQATVGRRSPGRFGPSADPAVGDQDSQTGLIPPSPERRAGPVRPQQRVQPAPGAEAQKRTQSDQPDSPPVRSSMTNRRQP